MFKDKQQSIVAESVILIYSLNHILTDTATKWCKFLEEIESANSFYFEVLPKERKKNDTKDIKNKPQIGY